MKVLIVSDTHGKESNLIQVLRQEGMPDCLIHLGDSQSSEPAMRELVTCPVYMVAGNCDYFCALPRTQIITLGSCRIMMTHGHYYYVSYGTEDLAREAKRNGCNVAMFGHTHRPLLDQSDPELTVLNPGSLSLPRQAGGRPSYIIMEINGMEPATYEIRYL